MLFRSDSFIPTSATTVSPSLLSPPPFVETAIPVAGTSASSESSSSDDVEPLTSLEEGVKKKDVALILLPGLTPEEGSEPLLNREKEVNMFVVSGHLYRPLLLSQSWELGGKILGGFGTRPRRFLVPG